MKWKCATHRLGAGPWLWPNMKSKLDANIELLEAPQAWGTSSWWYFVLWSARVSSNSARSSTMLLGCQIGHGFLFGDIIQASHQKFNHIKHMAPFIRYIYIFIQYILTKMAHLRLLVPIYWANSIEIALTGLLYQHQGQVESCASLRLYKCIW